MLISHRILSADHTYDTVSWSHIGYFQLINHGVLSADHILDTVSWSHKVYCQLMTHGILSADHTRDTASWSDIYQYFDHTSHTRSQLTEQITDCSQVLVSCSHSVWLLTLFFFENVWPHWWHWSHWQDGRDHWGSPGRRKRYSENCCPSTPPPLEVFSSNWAFSRAAITWKQTNW